MDAANGQLEYIGEFDNKVITFAPQKATRGISDGAVSYTHLSATRMIGHEMIVIDALDAGSCLLYTSIYYGNNTSTANLLALSFGIAPLELRSELIKQVVKGKIGRAHV